MDKAPEISVVITCYNRADYLRETLSGLLQQTLENWEAIIVDDKSTEDLEAVVKSFDDPRFHFYLNEGAKGPSGARNFGNSKARADIIAVADSDDIFLPHRLQITVDSFSEFPDTDVFYGTIYSFPDGSYDFKHYRHFAPYDRDMLYDRDFVPHVTVAYRRTLILEYPYDDSLSSAIDYDMLLNFADREKVFRWTTEPLMLYRRHSDQISTDESRKLKQRENAVLVRGRHAPYRHNPIHD